MTDFNQKTHDTDVAKALGYVNPYAAVKRHCGGPLTKREGIVQKVNQYGDAGEQAVYLQGAYDRERMLK